MTDREESEVDAIPSIAEISDVERAYRTGVASLGVAFKKLMQRWDFGLRDEETALRLMFFRWYAVRESYSTGLETAELLPAERIADELGGWPQLAAESAFVIGLLARWEAGCFGEVTEWERRGNDLLKLALEKEPSSRMIQHGSYFAGDERTLSVARVILLPEIHARFHGRGEMGAYMEHMLSYPLSGAGREE